MRSLINRRPTAATVISCTALFVALGGTSYAAVTLDGKDLKNRSVAASKVKTRTLTGTQVKNDGLTGKQIKESTLGTVPSAKAADAATRATQADRATTADKATTADTATTAENATRAQSAANADQLGGKPSSAFASGSVRVVRAWGPAVVGSAAGVSSNVNVSCNPDERAISGGGSWHQIGGGDPVTNLNLSLGSVYPITDPAGAVTGWAAHGRSFVAAPRRLQVHALCTPVQP